MFNGNDTLHFTFIFMLNHNNELVMRKKARYLKFHMDIVLPCYKRYIYTSRLLWVVLVAVWLAAHAIIQNQNIYIWIFIYLKININKLNSKENMQLTCCACDVWCKHERFGRMRMTNCVR